jgi:hypothetical protein
MNQTEIKIHEGFVSLKEDSFGRYYLRASREKPKAKHGLIGYVHVVGTEPNPEKKWKENILCWHDKYFDYFDGFFFEKPELYILKVGEGFFGLDIPNQKIKLFRAVNLFDGNGNLVGEDSWSLEDIKKSFIVVIKENLARLQ